MTTIIRFEYLRVYIPPVGTEHFHEVMNRLGESRWEAITVERTLSGGLNVYLKRTVYGTFVDKTDTIAPDEYRRLIHGDWQAYDESKENDG